MIGSPKKGQGERFFDCHRYEACLDFAAIENWKAFNCEHCGFYASVFKKTDVENEVKSMPTTPEKKENTRICGECKERQTISPGNPYCASCMSKKSWEARRVKKKAPVKSKKKDTTKDKAQTEKPQQNRNTALTIEFSKHVSVLREVEKLAEEEVRPVDLQVIFILKNYLNNTKAVKSI